MKKEFITSRGKAIIKNGVLYVRNIKPDNQLSWDVFRFFAFVIVGSWRMIDADRNSDYVVGAVFLITAFLYSETVIDLFFKRSLSNRIPLNKITNLEAKEDENGLDINLFIHLRSGRYKLVAFRRLENQHAPFIHYIEQHIAHPQLA